MGRCIVLLAICVLGTGLASAAEAPSPLTCLGLIYGRLWQWPGLSSV